MSRYHLGAYAALPSTHAAAACPEADGAVLAGLRREPRIAGLELPLYADGALHHFDESWLWEQLAPGWSYVITCLPGTMAHCAAGATFGLASEQQSGREAALAFAGQARAAVVRLQNRVGRDAVRAVLVHSAPRRHAAAGEAATAALTDALRTLRGWDWHGAEVWVEHCDAFVRGQAPAKGFLSLAAELAALAASDGGQAAPAGILVNWGRSVIEARSPGGAAEHVRAARAAGRLRGLIYSGVCIGHPDYGTWEDTHAPFAPTPGALLTEAEAEACLAAAGGGSDAAGLLVGLKVQTLPKSLGPDGRLAVVHEALARLEASDRHGI